MKYVFKNKVYRALIPVFDILGSMAFLPSKLFRKQAPVSPEKILIVRLDHIGDFVCTTPIFKNLKKRFPQATITVLINSASKELAYRDPNVDKVITFSPFYLARGDNSSQLKGLIRVIKDVKNIGFDLGMDPRGDLLSILIMWLGGIKYRVGYGITGGGFLLSKESRYDQSAHIIDRNLALLKDLDVPIEDKAPAVHFNEKDADGTEKLLHEKWNSSLRGQSLFFPEGPVKAVVIHPFAGAKAKEWSRAKFQELIDRLKKDGLSVLLVGSETDEAYFTNVIDMRGRLSLPQLAYLIKETGFFIGLDSGPANIAAALNVPSVIICSGTNIPQLWIPNNPNVRFIYKDTGCKPCENKICPEERYNNCMESVSVDDVIKAVEGFRR